MSRRYRITRTMREEEGAERTLTLEECKLYFSDKADFAYTRVYTVKGAATMSIEGDFFLWSVGGKEIPFRHYQGDLYVSGTDDAVIPKMLEVAGDLGADVAEG
ncbi:hypothetical protein ACFFNY_15120 [Paenibacillus hodogayensis]|uniref:Uncharacterized protein n=1 Tax=Paenibacillus hodogayensis TaxID=279208 RepID=A0ABV5VX47_9BACL